MRYKIDMNGFFREVSNKDNTFTISFGCYNNQKILWNNSFVSECSIINSIVSNKSGTKFAAVKNNTKGRTLSIFDSSGVQEESIDLEEKECNVGIGWFNDTTIATAGTKSITIIRYKRD